MDIVARLHSFAYNLIRARDAKTSETRDGGPPSTSISPSKP